MNILNKDEVVFFWGGPLSQWHACSFKICGVQYNCTEQYMMAEKARLFKDEEAIDKIMTSTFPREQKKLGRKVKGFDPHVWSGVCQDVVFQGSFAKFYQDEELKKILLFTDKKLLVEASPYDTVWGIGLGPEDANLYDRDKWKGTNLLGTAIMKARLMIRYVEGLEPLTL